MSEVKFTEGPWAAFKTTESDMFTVNCSPVEGGDKICEYSPSLATTCSNIHYRHTESNALDNANLIAAAPELYGLINRLLEDSLLDIGHREEAEVLLAKARGDHEIT